MFDSALAGLVDPLPPLEVEAALEAAVASFREQVIDRLAWAEWLRAAPEATTTTEVTGSDATRHRSSTRGPRPV